MIPGPVVQELFGALKGAEVSHETWLETRDARMGNAAQCAYLRIIARSLVTLLASMTGPEVTQ